MRVRHDIDDLAADMRRITVEASGEMTRIVGANVQRGARISRNLAIYTAGAHGKHYPNAIDAEMTGATTGEWGPDPSKPQGEMSFERGSRNQPAHFDLLNAADIITPSFHDDVSDLADRLFW